jgi:hypothetical protein
MLNRTIRPYTWKGTHNQDDETISNALTKGLVAFYPGAGAVKHLTYPCCTAYLECLWWQWLGEMRMRNAR